MQNHILLATLRVNKNNTQQDIANHLNVSLSTYKLYELGLLPMKLQELNQLSIYYNVSLNYLLGLSKKKEISYIAKEIDYKYLRFSVCFFRKKNHITQKELASEFKISLYSISKYEQDSTKISLNYLTLIAKKFHISVDYLCGRSLEKEY